MAQTNSASRGRDSVTGVFDGANHADRVVTALKDAGFAADQVSVETQGKDGDTTAAATGGGAALGALPGVAAGAALGLILGLLTGLGILPLPGADAGPIVAALVGAVLGAIVGGLIGLLLGSFAGRGAADAGAGGKTRRPGSILLTVNARDSQQAQKARELFKQHGAADVRA